MSDEKHITKDKYINDVLSEFPRLSKEHLANMWEHYFLIPIDKDKTVIPKGDYCYVFTKEKNEYGIPKTLDCPYHSYKEINGTGVVWCDYLELGGLLNEGCDEKCYQKLIEFFGSEESVNDSLPLDLLFDSCKSCGVNEYTKEEEDEVYGKY